MEPVTHVLTGACLARSGFNRKAAYATAAMAVAAEFPDIDTVWSLRGPVSGFEHHRGITHTFAGLPLEAAVLVLLFWGIHRFRLRRGSSAGASLTRAPVSWTALYFLVCLALLSHLLLDFTNNYGVRPFFPVNPHWYAASIVFIFDPWIFLLLVAGLAMPSLFALVSSEIAGGRPRFAGTGWARSVLVLIALFWGLRFTQHERAVRLGQGQTLRAPASPDGNRGDSEDRPAVRPLLRPRATLANPDPFNPFRWYTATDFGPAYLLASADTRQGEIAPGQVLTKAASTTILTRAERERLGRVYLDWSPMPWITVEGQGTDGAAPVQVTFRDLRFMGDNRFAQRGKQPPLTGFVRLGVGGSPVEQGLGDREEK